jgi:hypothetical protein
MKAAKARGVVVGGLRQKGIEVRAGSKTVRRRTP